MEETVESITLWAGWSLEILAVSMIFLAAIYFSSLYLKTNLVQQTHITKEEIRVRLGIAVSFALELLLGADVIMTAVAPSWDEIGKLSAIVVLRTSLNYFLEKELIKVKINNSQNEN